MKPPLFLMVTLWPRPQNWQHLVGLRVCCGMKVFWNVQGPWSAPAGNRWFAAGSKGLEMSGVFACFCCFHEKPGMIWDVLSLLSVKYRRSRCFSSRGVVPGKGLPHQEPRRELRREIRRETVATVKTFTPWPGATTKTDSWMRSMDLNVANLVTHADSCSMIGCRPTSIYFCWSIKQHCATWKNCWRWKRFLPLLLTKMSACSSWVLTSGRRCHRLKADLKV